VRDVSNNVVKNSSARRAVVTGFCAAHPLLNRAPAPWMEYSSARPPALRALFESELLVGTREYSHVAGESWWTRFFGAKESPLGIIGELQNAGLWRDGKLQIDVSRVGVCFSSSKGRPALLENLCAEKSGEYLLRGTCDWAAREILKRSGARGKTGCPVAACASGAHAIILGAQWIEDGLCDAVICGALEAELAPIVLAGYRSLGALSTRGVMRPFDEARDGFVPASGGACLILENENSARARNAKLWGLVGGYSMKCDATSLTGMDTAGVTITCAMRNALPCASTHPLHYINAHGTATRQNDEIEARAIRKMFGDSVPVSSTKALTGHLLGAAGAVEAVLCLLAMEQKCAPPNLNLENADIACAGLDLPKQARAMKIGRALSLSYGFGGHIGVLCLSSLGLESLEKN
jgi:3-oxoacyl-[acyl-carrier-protein] synthase II